jgi:hypothetical protein
VTKQRVVAGERVSEGHATKAWPVVRHDGDRSGYFTDHGVVGVDDVHHAAVGTEVVEVEDPFGLDNGPAEATERGAVPGSCDGAVVPAGMAGPGFGRRRESFEPDESVVPVASEPASRAVGPPLSMEQAERRTSRHPEETAWNVVASTCCPTLDTS